MTKQVQRRRGTATQHTSFTGAEGETSVNTTNKSVHVHDGATAGGVEAARADLVNVSDANLNAALTGNTVPSLTITTADINGGTIDGTVIGGATAAAVTGTAITGTSFTTTGDMSFGDNDKAIFGAGSDLQIYHDGSHSVIKEAGTGNLQFYADTRYQFFNADGSASYAQFIGDGGAGTEYVQLRYGNSPVLSTTATGIDVTGTITSDGLTVATTGEVIGTIGSTSTAGARQATLRLNVASTGGDDPAGKVQFTYGAGYSVAGSIEMTHTNPNMKFLTGTTERMRIDSSGNVGIGVVPASNTRFYTRTAATTDRGFYTDNGADSGFAVQFASSLTSIGNDFNAPLAFLTNNTERMRIDASGNVGIGTSSPQANLHVNSGASNLAGLFESDDAGVTITLIDNGTTGGSAAEHGLNAVGDQLELRAVDNLSFETAGTEAMHIDSSQNVLVGKTSTAFGTAGHTFTASGIQNATRAGGYVAAFNRLSSEGDILQFYKDGSTVGTISVTGSATAYNTSSDYRLKEDWTPIADASERVQALNPVNFAWKVDASRVDGFLAHELAEVIPEAVSGAKDAMQDEEYEVTSAVLDEDGNETSPAVMATRSVPDMQGIDQSKIVPLLTAALQEALTKIADLETRLTALEA